MLFLFNDKKAISVILTFCVMAFLPLSVFGEGEDDPLWNRPTYEKKIYHVYQRIATSNEISEPVTFSISFQDSANASINPQYNVITINQQLLNMVSNDDELAGIIAHELAHMTLSHYQERVAEALAASQRIKKEAKRGKGFKVAGSSIGSGLAWGATGNGLVWGMLAGISDGLKQANAEAAVKETLMTEAYFETLYKDFLKEQELAADSKAVEFLIKANYNPNSFKELISKLSGEGLATWRTHPANIERVTNIIKSIEENKPVNVQAVEGL
jgi:predicted Zn-dependent protease